MPDTRRVIATATTMILAGVVMWGFVSGETGDRDRVEALGSRIRCPVCQGESIVDSPTPYAQDILAFVEEKVGEGWSDERILAYLEDRFDGIRLDPRFSGRTVALWLLPMTVAVSLAFLATRRLMSKKRLFDE